MDKAFGKGDLDNKAAPTIQYCDKPTHGMKRVNLELQHPPFQPLNIRYGPLKPFQLGDG